VVSRSENAVSVSVLSGIVLVSKLTVLVLVSLSVSVTGLSLFAWYIQNLLANCCGNLVTFYLVQCVICHSYYVVIFAVNSWYHRSQA